MQDNRTTSDRPSDPGSLVKTGASLGEDKTGQNAVDFPVAVVLPAGGSGERMGLATPKQFCPLLNRPLISYTVEAFERVSWIETIVVVVAKESLELMLHIAQKFHHTKVKVVEGGATRHRSIFNGLRAFCTREGASPLPRPEVVIIHDAVRPFVEENLLLQVTLAAKEQGASGTIRPLVSTVIATTSEGYLDHSLERAKYRASEMPQGFLYDVIYQAYQRCNESDFDFGTECLHLALQYTGTNARLLDGPPTLWKVTYKRDLAAAESIIKDTLSVCACIIPGAWVETAKLASQLQKALAACCMILVKLVRALDQTRLFIFIQSLCERFDMIRDRLGTEQCYVTHVFAGEARMRLPEKQYDTVDVFPCAEGKYESLLNTRNFIQISESVAGLSDTGKMVKALEDTRHALLYPVVIVWVHLYMVEDRPPTEKDAELTTLMDLSTTLAKGNILLYGVQVIHSKVPELWERSVERLSHIIAALIRDRNPALTGQLFRA